MQIYNVYSILATTVVQTSSAAKFDEYFIPIITGLIVAFVPFCIRYLNRKFEQITSTAEQVNKHHKSNKKRLDKLDRELRVIKANQAKTPSEIKSSNNA